MAVTSTKRIINPTKPPLSTEKKIFRIIIAVIIIVLAMLFVWWGVHQVKSSTLIKKIENLHTRQNQATIGNCLYFNGMGDKLQLEGSQILSNLHTWSIEDLQKLYTAEQYCLTNSQ